jgi:hypothetical protein
MILGMVCTAIAVILHPARFRRLKSTMPQVYAVARAGKLRTALVVHLLGGLGFVLIIWGCWRQWRP